MGAHSLARSLGAQILSCAKLSFPLKMISFVFVYVQIGGRAGAGAGFLVRSGANRFESLQPTMQGCPIGYHQQIDARSSAIMVMILDLDLGTDRREVLSFLHSSREGFFVIVCFGEGVAVEEIGRGVFW